MVSPRTLMAVKFAEVWEQVLDNVRETLRNVASKTGINALEDNPYAKCYDTPNPAECLRRVAAEKNVDVEYAQVFNPEIPKNVIEAIIRARRRIKGLRA